MVSDKQPDLRDAEHLAAELFDEVQTAQGYAYVGDGETFDTAAALFVRVRGRLAWSREVTRQLEAFLRKHGELSGDTDNEVRRG